TSELSTLSLHDALPICEHQIAEVRSRALPQINATGNLMYNAILQESALPGEFFGQPGTTILVPFGQKWMAIGGVNLTQNLFDYRSEEHTSELQSREKIV